MNQPLFFLTNLFVSMWDSASYVGSVLFLPRTTTSILSLSISGRSCVAREFFSCQWLEGIFSAMYTGLSERKAIRLVCFTIGWPLVVYFDYHLLLLTCWEFFMSSTEKPFTSPEMVFIFLFWVIFFFALFSLAVPSDFFLFLGIILKYMFQCFYWQTYIFFSRNIVQHGNWREVIMYAQPNVWN